MNPLDIHTPQRIRWLSRFLATTCLILITLLPIALVAYWIWDGEAILLATLASQSGIKSQGELLLWQRILVGLLSETPVMVFMVGLWQVRKCFLQFAQGRFFSSTAVRSLSRFAGWTMASTFTAVMTGALITLVITFHNPPGSHSLTVSFGSDQLLLLFFAGMVWVMASVIHQGQVLAEENASFI